MIHKSCYICDKREYDKYSTFISEHQSQKETCKCRWCGDYTITEDVKEFLSDLPPKERKKYKIQFYIREQNDKFSINPVELTVENVKNILSLPDKTIKKQFNLLLLNIFEKYPFINPYILNGQELEHLRVKSHVKEYHTLSKLFEKAYNEKFLNQEGRFESTFIPKTITIARVKDFTFKGLEYVELLKEKNTNSKKVFLAYKFEDNIRDFFNELSDDIRSKLEYEPIVVNQSTTSHDEKIGDKIIGELKSCRFLIADLSYHSNNVYYEIGYAMGMGIPAILTCKKEFMDNLAFDISQYPVFEWSNENELKEKVIDRIKAIL